MNEQDLKVKEITATSIESLERKVAKFIMRVRPDGGASPLTYIKCRAYFGRPIKRMRITYRA